ncbi:LuxR C-terminal-related transcriptional regulator [Bradyrhizobium sp.]|uniref:helix-turn-helix transcriptional regulator n=1 Tax=Bradyrhizobium sp. TaxID=376 RepID=UPI0025C29B44|nr:LuxR C-terminal-related transcriptional regulator [Bradyrhizobium sp.]
MIADITSDRLSAVIGKIYDSAVDPALWPDAIESACGLVGATMGSISIFDYRQMSMRWAAQWGGDPAWTKLFEEKYAALMPFWPAMQREEVGDISDTRRLCDKTGISTEEFCQSRFFLEWAKPAGYQDAINGTIMRSGSQMGAFHLYIPPTRDLVGPRDLAIAELLVPHIRRAVAIGDLLDIKSIVATAFETTLDTLAVAVVLVDADARIRHANAAAQAMLGAGAPIMSQDGLLRASSTQATSALVTAINRAARNESRIGLAGIGVPVSGRDGRPAIAHVLPLKSGKLRPDLAPGAVAAVFVTPARVDALLPVEALVALYELTPTEARVLVEIASGKNRAAAAEALGIADSTVKTHLARVFEKTGTSEQSELAKLVASLTPPVAARP